MRTFRIICLVVGAAGLLSAPAIAQAQTASAFLTVQNITGDPAASKMRVVVKNVGNLKVTACGLVASSQQYTQELFYAIGMESKLALPRPSGFGGIQPGESAELLLPLSQGGALTAEINAVILEDRTAVGDETVIASMFRQRLAYASEWERWALVMRGGSSRRASPAGRDAERAEILRGLGAASDERGDAATVAGRVAARKALRTLLVETQPENRASLLEYVEERAAALRLHARREGAVASFIPAVAGGGRASGRRNASVRPTTSEVRREEFSCRYPGQLFGIVGHSDVLDGGTGTARARSASKVEELGVTAIGACGVGSYVPTCNPEFFTTTSSSPSSATIMGVSATYLAGLGCAISGSQTTTLVKMPREEALAAAFKPNFIGNGCCSACAWNPYICAYDPCCDDPVCCGNRCLYNPNICSNHPACIPPPPPPPPAVTVSISGLNPLLNGSDPTVNHFNLWAAQGSPSGGTYQWTTNNGNWSFDNAQSSAPHVISGAAGCGTLTATYTRNGQSAQASANPCSVTLYYMQQDGSIQIISYNGPSTYGYQATVTYAIHTCPGGAQLQSGFSGIATSETVTLFGVYINGQPVQLDFTLNIGPGGTNYNSEFADSLSLLRTVPLPSGLDIRYNQNIVAGSTAIRNNILDFGTTAPSVTNNGPSSCPF